MDMKIFSEAQNNVVRGQMKSLREKIDSNPELITFSDRETLLHKAVMSERPDMVQYLLDQGADPNATDNQYKLMTPLHYAAVGGQIDILEILLAAGADVNLEDKNGNSALIYSLGMGRGFDPESKAKYEKIFFRLLDSGAKASHPGRLLNSAAGDGYVNVVKFLLNEIISEYPLPGQIETQPGLAVTSFSALTAAVINNRLEVVKLLLERGGASGREGQDGRNALREARIRNRDDIVEALLAAGVDPGEEPASQLPQAQEEVMKAMEAFFAAQENPEASRQQFEETVDFATKMFSGEVFDDIQQWRTEWVADHLARGQCAEKETRPLKEVLADLQAEFSKLDHRIMAVFNPGLSAREYTGLTRGETWPQDLAALYQWGNGSVEYGENVIFGPQIFSPLQDALSRRDLMAEISPEYYLPIMNDGAGGWIEVDLRTEDEFAGLTYDLYKEEQDSPTIYPGLNAYFGGVLACFRQGAFRVVPRAGKKGEDLLVGHEGIIRAVMARFALHLPEETISEMPVKEADDDGDGISVYDYTVALPSK